LLFATPRRWLEDGKQIHLERAPSAFGPLAIHVESHLSQGEVIVQLDLPGRNQPKQTWLRARVPDGWKVVAVRAAGRSLEFDDRGTVDISSLRGTATLHCEVKPL